MDLESPAFGAPALYGQTLNIPKPSVRIPTHPYTLCDVVEHFGESWLIGSAG